MAVGFIKEIAKKEVSCRIGRMIVKFAERSGISSDKLLRGTGANLPYLYDAANWTGENLIVRMLENLEALLSSSDAAYQAGKSIESLADDELLDLIFNTAGSPPIFYRNLPKWFSLHFKIADLQLVKEEKSSISYKLQSRRRKSLSIPLLQWFAGMLAGVCRAFNLSEADVVFKPPVKDEVRLYTIEVEWRDTRPGEGTRAGPIDEKKADLIIRKLIKRIEKAEARKGDMERLSFLLRESEGRFRIFFDNVMESVLIIDEGGFIFEANKKALEMLQRRRDDLVGMPAAKLVDDHEEEMIIGLLNLARQGRPIPQVDLELIRKDGKRIPIQASASSVVWPESSAPFKIVLNIKDMTSLRNSEEEARRMRDLNEIIVNGMLEGIFVEDAEGTCKFANPRMEEMLGYGSGEMKNMHWSEFAPEDFMGTVEEEMARRRMGVKNSYEAALKKKGGTRIPVKISALPLFERGSFTGVLSVIIDMSDVRKD
jgi:PAS domain S-box-containing protein